MDLTPSFITLGVLWYLSFLFSTTCHEASHALAGKLGGDLTAFHGGQVTLNPVPHITREPFGMVLVPILSYALGGVMIGWASAPYDPRWQRQYPRRAAWMSLAGPGANFALAIVAAVLIHVGIGAGAFEAPEYVRSASRITEVVDIETAGRLVQFAAPFLSILFFQNILLGSFNLLPLPPLDGATGITVFMPQNMALRFIAFMQNPTFQMVGLVVAWSVFNEFFSPIFALALSLLYPGSSYQ